MDIDPMDWLKGLVEDEVEPEELDPWEWLDKLTKED